MKNKLSRRMAMTTLVATLTLAAAPAHSIFKKKKSPEKQREEIHEIEEQVLAQLREEEPAAAESIENAAGYAVFDNTGLNLGLVSSANGKGLAYDNESEKYTYMKMYSLGGGVGLGIKSFQAVFVFHDRDALTQFIEEGWDLSGQADAAATEEDGKEDRPGVVDASVGLMKGVSVYQFTDKGLALQATLQGTKYWKNDDLNED